MPRSLRMALLLALCGLVAVATFAQDSPGAPQENAMTKRATGPFDVKMAPQAPDEGHEETQIGRMLLEKTFHGDLDAKSLGQMLAVRTPVESSAGYVAMERVTGTLHGKKGSFTLQHSGTMSGGDQHLDLAVVPDSATGELTGLAGTMSIRIEEGGKHFYDFEYTLPASPSE